MKKQFRLQHNREFQRIIKSRKQFVNKSVILYYEENDKHLRVGLSISKKFCNAAKRNLMRRKARAIIRSMDLFEMKYNVVLIFRKHFIHTTFKKQEQALRDVFERLENEKQQY